jgi:cytoskeletal protein RodZ
MINQPPNMNIEKQIDFGIRLTSCREALGMDIKEAAAQLRLSEKIIVMMESGEFEPDLPLMFLKGYLRNYSKLLAIPEDEVQEALQTLSPRPETIPTESHTGSHLFFSSLPITMKLSSLRLNNFFMQSLKYLIGLSLIGLICISLFTHKTPSHQENTVIQTSLDKTENPEINPAKKTMAPAQPLPGKSTRASSFSKLTFLQMMLGLIFLLFAAFSGLYVYKTYYTKKTRPVSRTRKMSRRQPNLFIKPSLLLKLTYSFNHFYNKKIILIAAGVLAAVIGFFGIHKVWHDQPHGTRVVMTTPKTAAPALDFPLSPFNIYAGVEKLAPSYDLYTVLSSGEKTHALYALTSQLRDYLAYAAAVKFALTDPSTPLGQLPLIKKSRKYRRVYYQTRKPDTIPPYYRYYRYNE